MHARAISKGLEEEACVTLLVATRRRSHPPGHPVRTCTSVRFQSAVSSVSLAVKGNVQASQHGHAVDVMPSNAVRHEAGERPESDCHRTRLRIDSVNIERTRWRTPDAAWHRLVMDREHVLEHKINAASKGLRVQVLRNIWIKR